jgi:hypothetical protein
LRLIRELEPTEYWFVSMYFRKILERLFEEIKGEIICVSKPVEDLTKALRPLIEPDVVYNEKEFFIKIFFNLDEIVEDILTNVLKLQKLEDAKKLLFVVSVTFGSLKLNTEKLYPVIFARTVTYLNT